MVELIIKQTNVDPYAEQEMEDLGASGLFDLSKVYSSFRQLYFIVCSSIDNCVPFSGTGAHVGASRQVCR